MENSSIKSVKLLDERNLACITEKNEILFYDIYSNKRYFYYPLKNGEWIVKTDKDFFAYSSDKLKNDIYFVEKNKIIRDTLLFNHFHKQELADKIKNILERRDVL